MDSQKLLSLINKVVRSAGDFRFAEAEELDIVPDSSCPSYKEAEGELNKVLSELWKAVSSEPEPYALQVHTHRCEVCEKWVDDTDYVGCCRDGECPERVEQMCESCATWCEKKEQWFCETCWDNKSESDEEEED